VTDRAGATVPGASVVLTGPVERAATTDQSGSARFANLRAGAYRVHVERQGFITLERELSLGSGGRATAVDLSLSPAPPPPKPPTAPPGPPPRTEPVRPVGEPRAVDVLAFAEKNPIERADGHRITLVGCTGYSATRVLQLREPLEPRTHQDADVALYAAKGAAIVNINSQEFGLNTGGLMVVPRGTTYSISPRGRGPAVLLWVMSGPPCTEEPK
jgi:mannose-6-phosphate isomerase-like protein (cupin superfamily)